MLQASVRDGVKGLDTELKVRRESADMCNTGDAATSRASELCVDGATVLGLCSFEESVGTELAGIRVSGCRIAGRGGKVIHVVNTKPVILSSFFFLEKKRHIFL